MKTTAPILTTLLLLSGNAALSQNPNPTVPAGLTGEQRDLRTRELSQQSAADFEKLRAISRATNFPLTGKLPGGGDFAAIGLRNNRPIYFGTSNENAAISVTANVLREAPHNLDGTGCIAGIWESGYPRWSHTEFQNDVRISGQDQNTPPTTVHATHVAGTIVGRGMEPEARGMASGLEVRVFDFDNHFAEISSHAAATPHELGKICLSNHSYGQLSGWESGYFFTSAHEDFLYYGDMGMKEDPTFGQYNYYCAQIDQLCWDFPFYLPIKAADNHRNDHAPAPGQNFYYWNNGWQSTSYNPAIHAGPDYQKGGYDTISGFGGAKNILTVGAVSDAALYGVRDLDFTQMTDYSSWGPTDDGRIKPDIVANGVALYSAGSSNDYSYLKKSGTSMATAVTTGASALVLQHYAQLFPGQQMRNSTLKALLIHTADDLGNPGPDYQFGWGLLNVESAAKLITDHKNRSDRKHMTESWISNSVPERTFKIHSEGNQPLRATLAWVDPSSPEIDGLNNPQKALIRDLDLRIYGPSGENLPFTLNPADPGAWAGRGDDSINNVEQVFIENPVIGEYTVRVTKKGNWSENQSYSLIVSGQGNPIIAGGPTGNAFVFY